MNEVQQFPVPFFEAVGPFWPTESVYIPEDSQHSEHVLPTDPQIFVIPFQTPAEKRLLQTQKPP